MVNNPDLDCSGGTPKEKESIKFLNSICLNYDLIDIWRTRNPDRKLFSWKQKNPLVQRRLDFWLISDVCQDERILLLDEQTRGPSYWKFNSSLVDDENYVLAINQKIPEWLGEF